MFLILSTFESCHLNWLLLLSSWFISPQNKPLVMWTVSHCCMTMLHFLLKPCLPNQWGVIVSPYLVLLHHCVPTLICFSAHENQWLPSCSLMWYWLREIPVGGCERVAATSQVSVGYRYIHVGPLWLSAKWEILWPDSVFEVKKAQVFEHWEAIVHPVVLVWFCVWDSHGDIKLTVLCVCGILP